MRALRSVVRTLRVVLSGKENKYDLVKALARRPWLLMATGAAETAAMLSNKVDGKLKLLAEFRVASLVGCDFCLDIGAALAEYEQLDARQLKELAQYETSDAFNDDERLVLRYATALSGQRAEIPDDLRTAMNERFTRTQIVELAATIAHEHERSRFYTGIGLPPSRFSSGECAIAKA